MATRALFITGATGKQGKSAISAILKTGAPFDIIALTRNVQSDAAQNLLKQSPKIKLVKGDFDAIDDVLKRAKVLAGAPIWGIFSVQAVTKNEEAEGKKLVDAALKHGVQHLVYTSADRGVNSDNDPTNVPHFITKYNIEQHLMSKAKGTNMTWTILRPVAFFENLTPDFFGKVFTSTFAWRLGKTQKLQLISTTDIGYFASQAFVHAGSEQYKNKSISLASEELTFDEMKDVFQKTTGQKLPTTYTFIVVVLNWISEELGSMFKWFRDVGFGVNIKRMREINPNMKDFETWLKTESAWKRS